MKTRMFRLLGTVLSLVLLGALLIAGWFWWQQRPHPSNNPPYQVWFTQPGQPSEADDQRVCQWLSEAEHSLDMAVFEISLPCIAEILPQRLAAGVQVRIVTDSDYADNPVIQALKAKHIPVVADQRAAFMHNKFIIRDQQSVWSGSLNLTNNGLARNNNNVIVLEHPAMAALYRAEFEEMFLQQAFGPRSPRQDLPALFEIPTQTGLLEAEVLFSPEDPVQERILDLLNEAQQQIVFMAFAFTDRAMQDLLLKKSQVGVTVQGLYENRGAGSRYSTYGPLKQAGLDVRRDGNPGMMHHKVMVIDAHTVITGSYNFSQNAAQSNDENVLILKHPELAQAYLQEFQLRFAQGK